MQAVLKVAQAGDGSREGRFIGSCGGPPGCGRLGVGIDNEDFRSPAGQGSGQVHGEGGLAGAALLVDQRDDASDSIHKILTVQPD